MHFHQTVVVKMKALRRESHAYLRRPFSAVKHAVTFGLDGSIVTILVCLLAISAGLVAAFAPV